MARNGRPRTSEAANSKLGMCGVAILGMKHWLRILFNEKRPGLTVTGGSANKVSAAAISTGRGWWGCFLARWCFFGGSMTWFEILG